MSEAPEMVGRIAFTIGASTMPNWNQGLHWNMNPNNRDRLYVIARQSISHMLRPTPEMIRLGERLHQQGVPIGEIFTLMVKESLE